jgi:hypothetical protein
VSRSIIAAVAALAIFTPAMAIEFEKTEQGQIEFVMPSGNVGCIYTPAGGTSTYATANGGAELSCDRVSPAYVRVILGASSKARRHDNPGDASCCGSANVFRYGQTWSEGGFTCTSLASGLKCRRGNHGFFISRTSIKVY